MNRIKKAMLIGTALVTFYAGLLGACKRDYDTTPIEPTAVHTTVPTEVPTLAAPTATSVPSPTPDLDGIVTPTAEASPTAIASPTAQPSPTAEASPTPKPTYTPEPTPTPKSTYDLALENLDYRTAEHWRGVARNYNSETAINELVFLPEQGRLVLAEDLEAYTADGVISDEELSDLVDPDKDGKRNSEDSSPMDPSNSTEDISAKTFSFVRNLVEHNDSQGDGRILPEIYSGLERVIPVVELNPELIIDFTSLQNHVLASLVSGIPGIAEYPKAMRQGAIQVTSQGLADGYSMENFVVPAIAHIVKLQDEGKIDVLNGFGIPDAELEAEGIRHILLPVELREVNISTGVRTRASLETGIYNVTPIEGSKVVGYTTIGGQNPVIIDFNGRSPQEWLRDTGGRDFNDKNSNGYKFVYRENAVENHGPGSAWPNSAEKFAEGMNELIQSGDDLAFFLIRYPTYLRAPASHPIVPGSGQIVPKLTEQASPYYSVLLGRLFGEAFFDVRAKYPVDPDGRLIHTEPFVLTSNTSDDLLLPYRFGFWPERLAFIDDYKGKPFNTPHAEVRHADGTYEIIKFDQDLTPQKK